MNSINPQQATATTTTIRFINRRIDLVFLKGVIINF